MPPSQTWRIFIENRYERRRIVHFNVTAHPTAEWTAQQFREAFPWDTAPRYLLRDRDRIFGRNFVDQVKAMGIKQVLSAPRSPWQRAYVERVIGSIRRECLDHVIVFNERSLYKHLQSFVG
jgi:transposase InsO family protein